MNEKIQKIVDAITEEDCGYKNWKAYRISRRLNYSLEDYKDAVWQEERDCQQMIDMGR